MLLFPDQKTVDLNFQLKKAAFDQMKSSPLKAQLLLAFTLFHDKNQNPFITPTGEFAMPDLGWCSARSPLNLLRCRLPLRRPESLLLSTEMAASTCPLGEGKTPARTGELARQFLRSDDGPAEMGISPVKTIQLYLSSWNGPAVRDTPGICPGTPLVLSNPQADSRGRIELQFDSLSLADYQRGSGLGKVIIKP